MDQSGRLLSLDVLRGFDMMFIMGLASLITSLCNVIPGMEGGWLAQQMHHVEWNGLQHHDTIFPLFLFIAGISFPFSFAKMQEKGVGRFGVYRKILTRAALLFLFGLVCNGLLRFDFGHLRWCSVLGRIGIAWMFAALLYVNLRTRTRGIVAACILVGYYLIVRFIPAPDFPGADPLSLEGNIVGYIDRSLLGPAHVYTSGLFDPEGMFSTLPAIVTAMLGMFTGEWVRREGVSGGRKTLAMLAAAAALLALGMVWSLDFPLNKKLWSSSFVLVVGAYSLACFAVLYWIIDVRGCRGVWTTFFKVFGMNSIAVYMINHFVNIGHTSRFFFSGLSTVVPEQWAPVVLSAGSFAVIWLIAYFLYRQKIFLKV